MKKTSRTKEETHKGRDAKIIFTVEKILADEKLRQERKYPEWMVKMFAEMGLDIYNLPPLTEEQKKRIEKEKKEWAAMPKSERTLVDFEFSLLRQRVVEYLEWKQKKTKFDVDEFLAFLEKEPTE